MTTELTVLKIKSLFDESKTTDSWELYKRSVIDYVTGQSYYIGKANKAEELHPGETFLSNREFLFENEHTFALFETWIRHYYFTSERYGNTFSYLKANEVQAKSEKPVFSVKDAASLLAKEWHEGKYVSNYEYLEDQFTVRGEEISSPGNTVIRRMNELLRFVLTGEPNYPFNKVKIWALDFGLRIGFERIIYDYLIKNDFFQTSTIKFF